MLFCLLWLIRLRLDVFFQIQNCCYCCQVLLSIAMAFSFIVLQFPIPDDVLGSHNPLTKPGLQVAASIIACVCNFIAALVHATGGTLLDTWNPKTDDSIGTYLFWLLCLSTGGFVCGWSSLYQFTVYWKETRTILSAEWTVAFIILALLSISALAWVTARQHIVVVRRLR